MGSGSAAGLFWVLSSRPPFSTCLLGDPGLLLGGGGAGFFFGSVCTSVIHGGSFLGAGILEEGQGKGSAFCSLASFSLSQGGGEKLPPLFSQA